MIAQAELEQILDLLAVYWKRGCRCAKERTPVPTQLCDVCVQTAKVLMRYDRFEQPGEGESNFSIAQDQPR